VPDGDNEGPQRDNNGYYVSCGQMLVKENDVQDDTQGLGTFFRYGYAPSTKNDLTQFYSTGLSYQGFWKVVTLMSGTG
jgi:hypothetical protein